MTLANAVYRQLYYDQKSSHGFGDFDKISARLGFIDFEGVVYTWGALNLICLVTPFILYFVFKPQEQAW